MDGIPSRVTRDELFCVAMLQKLRNVIVSLANGVTENIAPTREEIIPTPVFVMKAATSGMYLLFTFCDTHLIVDKLCIDDTIVFLNLCKHELVPQKLDNGKACILCSAGKVIQDTGGRSGDVFDIIVHPSIVEDMLNATDVAIKNEEMYKVRLY